MVLGDAEVGVVSTGATGANNHEASGVIRRRRPSKLGKSWVSTLSAIVMVTLVLIPPDGTFASFTAAQVTNSTNTAGTRTWFTCNAAETSTAGGTVPYLVFAMNPTVTTETDLTGNLHTGTYSSVPTIHSGSGGYGCVRDNPKSSVTFAATNCLNLTTTLTAAAPGIYSIEAWFRTTGTGMVIATYSDTQAASGGTNTDRIIYIDDTGKVRVGGMNLTRVKNTRASANAVNDGQWHHVIGTYHGGATPSLALYTDGVAATGGVVAKFTSFAYSGWWKVGCGNLNGWPTGVGAGTYATTANPYVGDLQYVATYTTMLTAAQAHDHYLAGTP